MFTIADLAGTKAYVKYGQYMRFSTQQLVDCTYKKYKNPPYSDANYACNGGYNYLNAKYVATNGLMPEFFYPYMDKTQ